MWRGDETMMSKEKILIVDDHPLNIKFLQGTLGADYFIVSATNGEGGLHNANSADPPDLILLDIMMPGLDGYEVCERLKSNEKTRHIPVIFLTGRNEEEAESRGFNVGGVDYIVKPFHPNLVKARVRTHLDLKRHRDRLQELVNLRTAELQKSNEELQSEIDDRKRFQEALQKATNELERRVKERTEALSKSIIDMKNLLKEQEIDIGLAKKILGMANGSPPRYIPLSKDLVLFVDAISIPCNKEGGDHFFVRNLKGNVSAESEKTVMSLKDQSGHKVGCILRSIITDLLHNAILAQHSPQVIEDIITKLNQKICRSELFDSDDFFTSMNVQIDNEIMTLHYVSTGHPPFLLIRDNTIITLPDPGGMGNNIPIPVTEKLVFSAGEYQLLEGDKLIFYTDGLIEMPQKKQKKTLSVEELKTLIARLIMENGFSSVSDITTGVLKAISEMSGEQVLPFTINTSNDDITLICMEIENRSRCFEELVRPQKKDNISDYVNKLTNRLKMELPQIGYKSLERIRAVLEEAMLNAWIHGNRKDPDKDITVRWRLGNDFHLEVIDEGDGFDYESIPDPTLSENVTKTSGRGIFIMRFFADTVTWEGNGSHVIASFKNHPMGMEKTYLVGDGFALQDGSGL